MYVQARDRDTCCICLEHMGQRDACVLLACSHVLHRECVAQWVVRSAMPCCAVPCPLCKRTLWHLPSRAASAMPPVKGGRAPAAASRAANGASPIAGGRRYRQTSWAVASPRGSPTRMTESPSLSAGELQAQRPILVSLRAPFRIFGAEDPRGDPDRSRR